MRRHMFLSEIYVNKFFEKTSHPPIEQRGRHFCRDRVRRSRDTLLTRTIVEKSMVTTKLLFLKTTTTSVDTHLIVIIHCAVDTT